MGEHTLHLGDADGPSPNEYAAMMVELAIERRCPPMTDAEIDAMAALFGQ
ncbi:hypothetical protein [Methylobacterium sp. Gmos1]